MNSKGGGGRAGLMALLVADFIAYGNTLTIFGATVPQMREAFGWTLPVTGGVLAAGAGAAVLATLAAGFLVERMSPRILLTGGLVLGAASLGLFARWPSPLVNGLLNVCVGIYMGIMEAVTNSEAVRLERGGTSRLMTLLHAGFSFGAILGPLLVAGLLGLGGSWRTVFPASGGLLLALAVPFLLLPFPDRGHAHQEKPARPAMLLRQPLLLALTFAIVLYVGSELGLSNWSAEYFTTELGASPPLAAFSVSALWIGLLAGRLTLTLGYHGKRQDVLLLALSLACTGCLLAFRAVRSAQAGLVLVFLLGAAYSGIYPFIITLTGRTFRSSAAVGIVATGGGIGSFAFPFLFAGVAQAAGLRGGLLLLALLPLGSAAAAALVVAGTARHARRGDGSGPKGDSGSA